MSNLRLSKRDLIFYKRIQWKDSLYLFANNSSLRRLYTLRLIEQWQLTHQVARMENQSLRSSKGKYRGGRGNRKNRALARTIGWFDIKSRWLACPGRDERRVLATPDGTDALSDVKLKHAALTRRFDDTPYNLTSHSLAPSLYPSSRSLHRASFLSLFPPIAISRSSSDRDSGSGLFRIGTAISSYYDGCIDFFF